MKTLKIRHFIHKYHVMDALVLCNWQLTIGAFHICLYFTLGYDFLTLNALLHFLLAGRGLPKWMSTPTQVSKGSEQHKTHPLACRYGVVTDLLVYWLYSFCECYQKEEELEVISLFIIFLAWFRCSVCCIDLVSLFDLSFETENWGICSPICYFCGLTVAYCVL